MKQKYIDGEWVTVEDLIKKHKRFIYKQANNHRVEANYVGLSIDDLFSAGAIGLIKAFDKYDEDKKVKFLTFAGPNIFGYIRREISSTNHLVRLPAVVYEAMRIIRMNNLADQPLEKVAEETNIKPNILKMALDNMQHSISYMQDKMESDEEGTYEYYYLIDEGDPTAFFVNDFLQGLTDTERKVVVMKMNGHTGKDIGNELGKSRAYYTFVIERVREKYLEYTR